MKATVEMTGERYDIWGLRIPSVKPLNEEFTNGKSVYELVYLHTFKGKTYKTIENAIKALLKKGFEYVPSTEIITVCGWD